MESGGFPVIFLDGVTLLLVATFAIVGLVVPIGAVLGAGAISHFPIFESDVLHAAKLTAFQAGVSAAIALVVGTGLGFLVHRGQRFSRLSQTLLALPFGVPAVVASSAWVGVLGKSGLNLGFLYTLAAVIVSHVFFNAPWVALWVSRALDELSISQREAAKTLGATAWQEFWYLSLPEIFPTLVSVFTQVFAFCAMSFILVLILGGGPPVETLETALYIKVRSGGLDLSGAAACAFWQLLLTFVPWVVLNGFGPKTARGRRPALFNRKTETSTSVGSLTLSSFSLLSIVVFLIPYLSILRWRSVVHLIELCGQAHSREAVFDALLNSFEIAVPTALLAMAIALSGVWLDHRVRFKKGYSDFIGHLMIFPSGISTMVLGLGLFIAYRNEVDPFSSSLIPVIFLQSVFFVAVAFRVLRPVSVRFQQTELEAARTLGAGVLRGFWEVERSRWKMPMIASFSLILGAALGEVGAVSLFYNEKRVPLSLLLSRWTSQYRFEDAQSVALFLMFISLSMIALGVSYDRK
jgi:thiamine transport system permease protein